MTLWDGISPYNVVPRDPYADPRDLVTNQDPGLHSGPFACSPLYYSGVPGNYGVSQYALMYCYDVRYVDYSVYPPGSEGDVYDNSDPDLYPDIWKPAVSQWTLRDDFSGYTPQTFKVIYTDNDPPLWNDYRWYSIYLLTANVAQLPDAPALPPVSIANLAAGGLLSLFLALGTQPPRPPRRKS